jgi:hypothetical protein
MHATYFALLLCVGWAFTGTSGKDKDRISSKKTKYREFNFTIFWSLCIFLGTVLKRETEPETYTITSTVPKISEARKLRIYSIST